MGRRTTFALVNGPPPAAAVACADRHVMLPAMQDGYKARLQATVKEVAARLESYLDLPMLDQAGFAAAVGVNPDAVDTLLATGEVFAMVGTVGDDRTPSFPRWLAHDGKILPGLSPVLAALRSNGEGHCLAVVAFLCEPRVDLHGRRVRDLMAEGKTDEATKLAAVWRKK